MENANSQSLGGGHYSPLFPLSYLRLHSNRLTNVPWKFTLDTGSRGSKRKVAAAAAAERRLQCDVEAVCPLFNPELLLLTIY